ncbi:MAG: hypothetical protein ACWA5W_02775 [Phycisphaerales bacterium]
MSEVKCPECGLVVTNTEAHVRVARMGAFWSILGAGIAFPMVNLALCWVMYFKGNGGDTAQIFMWLIVWSVLYQIATGMMLLQFIQHYRHHLSGTHRWPPGWMFTTVVANGWVITAGMLIASLILWYRFMPWELFL